MLFIAERVARRRILETDGSSDITAVDAVDFLTVVRMHLQDTADALFLALRGVVHVRAAIEDAGVYAEECELADVRIRHDLECESGERLIVARRTMVLFARFRVDTSDRRNIRRSRHVIDDCIEERLDTLVAIGSTAGDRAELAGNRTLADNSLDLVFRDLLAAEIFLHEVIIELGKSLEEDFTVFFSLILHVIRNRDFIFDFAEVVFIDDGFHLDEIDDALERILSANRQLDCNCVCIEAFLHHLDDIEEVRAGDVHLVDISHTRNIVILSLTPNGLSLRLNAAASSQDCYSAIEYAQGTLNLYREVHVTRRINDVDAMIFPMAGRCSGRDRDTTLLLLNHPVHRCSTIMYFTDLVVDTRVEEDTLRGRRLTGIDVSHDTDVTSLFKGILSCHFCSPSLNSPPVTAGED